MKCPHCKRETALYKYDPEEYRRRKISNIQRSMAKAKADGTPIGRPRSVSYSRVCELRKQGFTLAAIAHELKCTISTVQRALKLTGKDTP